jgi:hypothetical protein
MSELPQIDPLKVAQREVAKLSADLAEYRTRETQLEILAEALRDQRDEALAGLQELRDKLDVPEVHDIASLPSEK